MNETSEHDKTNKSLEESEQLLIASEISEQMVLDHPSYKQLADQLSQVEQKSQEHWNNWLLAQAELENLKRRTEREVANAHKYALDKFAYEILTVVDNLERSLVTKISGNEALKDFYVGIELTLKSLLEILQKFGITPINPLGEMFDPEKHTAVTTKEDPAAKPSVVLEVVQKGYWLKDRLLRPALVVVAK
ncbi:MAG TPA: nucleotide exchange factor GrpE [Coxiellaceae bacterium]|nr:MAG: nucleotide exchange factor GrpE [Gammaproteobacteria bacterium RBG_16_37_9]HBC71849.1 nucleotide exchange factor GrpE [Coxiellaceae bacterium]HBS52012.1 nucleotide exchange factor GrpE [Coxiellaceae bacterium]HBY56246.1 nucleotide exchange factor GrpE [Coxiellaceae bacterium]